MNISEFIVFVIYLASMFAIGIYFFFKGKGSNEKNYFIGNRQMGAWVTALSAGAADMSAWVLMGLPTSVYAFGLGKIWIPVGLAIGYTVSWIFEAPRLRIFSIIAGDAITIPQYLSNRFLTESKILQMICASVFLIAYTIYSASSIKACGILFNTITGANSAIAMYIAAFVIISYTFLGGYLAVCWTDFFQGLLILGAMLFVPLVAVSHIDIPEALTTVSESFWNPFSNRQEVISGLAWGLGYFGMPHIIIRFMSLKSQKELKKSAKIGISWTVIIVTFATLIGVIGRFFFGFIDHINDNSLVFIEISRQLFPGLVAGILLSAVLAASMSTASSQLLAASSSFASDVYKPVIRKNKAASGELLWISRIVVLAVSGIALAIASNPNSGSIMDLVMNAWGLLGAAFGPTILLSLFWKRFNFTGAVVGIITGTIVDISWLIWFSKTGIYELAPGFCVSLIFATIASLLTKKPSQQVEILFESAVKNLN